MADSLRVAQVYTEFDTKGLKETQAGIDGLKKKVSSLAKLATGLVGTMALKGVASSFIKAAKEAEDYRISIRAVSKTVADADATFKRVKDWAAVNPIDTQQAIGAFVRLKTAAVSNAEGALKAMADVSTVMHRDMRDVAGAVVTTETETLRALGIMLDKTGKKAVIESNGVRVEVEKDINSIRAGIIEVMGKAFGGAMEKNKESWSGALATMGGMWQNFRTDIMGEGSESGAFASLKNALVGVNSEWEKFTTSDDYKELVETIQGALVSGIKTAVSAVKSLKNAFIKASEHAEALKGIVVALIGYKISLGLATAIANFSTLITQAKTFSGIMAGLNVAAGPAGWLALATGAVVGGGAYVSGKIEAEKAAEKAKNLKMILEDLDSDYKGAGLGAIEKGISEKNTQLAALNSEIDKAAEKAKKLLFKNEDFDRDKFIKMNTSRGWADKLESLEKEKAALESYKAALLEVAAAEEKEIKAKEAAEKEAEKSRISQVKAKAEETAAKAKEAAAKAAEELKRKEEEETNKILENARKVKTEAEKLKTALADALQEERNLMSWRHSQGIDSDEKYLSYLQERLNGLKAAMGGLADNVNNWTDPMRSLYGEIQGVTINLIKEAIESVNCRFEKGTISVTEYKDELQKLIKLYEYSPQAVDLLTEAEKRHQAIQTNSKSAISKMLDETKLKFDSLSSTITVGLVDAFAQFCTTGESVSDTLKQMAKDIVFTITKMIILQTLMRALNIGGKGATAVKTPAVKADITAHTGGFIGTNKTLRSLSSILPTFHSGGLPGLKSDEVLAKLQTGEAVFSRKDVKNLGKMGDALKGRQAQSDSYTTINIHAVDAPSFVQMLQHNKAVITSIVSSDIMKNGQVRAVMRGAM